jgi:hypothetical protein
MRHEVGDAAVPRGGIATWLLALATPLPPAARSSRMRHAACAATLVPTCGFATRVKPCRTRTRAIAIALAAVTTAAQQHLCAATRAHEQAGGMVGQLPSSSGGLPRKTPTEMGCRDALTSGINCYCIRFGAV